MDDPRTFVIVGAGQAGRWLVLTLRTLGFAGRIVWFGDEAHAPYERPPLSKAVLSGEVALEQLALIASAKFAELKLDWRPGTRVVAIDRRAREVVPSGGDDGDDDGGGGDRVRYDALFLAHGGRARMLPGLAPHPRVLALRSWEDARALKAAIGQAQRVLVLGGGWIGLEVAASARRLGCAVTVVEAAPRLCVRTVPPVVSDHLLALHQGHGVEVRLGDGVECVLPGAAGVRLVLASGAVLEGDLLVVGIGLIANDELAAAAGIACGNGVLTDSSGRTSDPAIFAVGDVANAARPGGQQRARIESWENAERQAVAAAHAALGLAHDPHAAGPPWFWSDQYDDNLQLLGTPAAAGNHHIVERHLPAKRQRLWFFCEGARVVALAAVNGGREVKVVRKWMREQRFPAELARLADTNVDVNKLPLAEFLPLPLPLAGEGRGEGGGAAPALSPLPQPSPAGGRGSQSQTAGGSA